MRRWTVFMGALLVLAAISSFVAGAPVARAAGTPTSLVLPQSTAFGILGYSCGGITEQAYATGFDSSTGYPIGDAYLTTTCNGSGRGGHPSTHTAWASAEWDFTGAVVSATLLPEPPVVDPGFSATDGNGNQIYNQSGEAYLLLATGFVPTPRVTAISAGYGTVAGGTALTITGTGFTGATSVNFGASATVPPSGFTVVDDTSITLTTPLAPPGTVDVTVTNGGGTSGTLIADQFTFYAQPVVTGITPHKGPETGGTLVAVSGTGFTGVQSVQFDDNPAAFTVNSDTSITATSPDIGAADDESVTVTTLGGTSRSVSAGVFTFVPPSGVACGKISGNARGTITVSKCKPASTNNKIATATTLTGTLTWSKSGGTTATSLSVVPNGQGRCRGGSTEEDLYGTVTGGTSSYTSVGNPIDASVCLTTSGKVSLVPGTTFGL